MYGLLFVGRQIGIVTFVECQFLAVPFALRQCGWYLGDWFRHGRDWLRWPLSALKRLDRDKTACGKWEVGCSCRVRLRYLPRNHAPIWMLDSFPHASQCGDRYSTWLTLVRTRLVHQRRQINEGRRNRVNRINRINKGEGQEGEDQEEVGKGTRRHGDKVHLP